MGSSAPPASFTEVSGLKPVRVLSATPEHEKKVEPEPGPAAKAAAERLALRKAEISEKVLPDLLIIEKDESADRFVQTVLDDQTQEVVLRYPNETQLAFSRAVAAYMRAQSES